MRHMDGDENDIAILETNVTRRVAVYQVVVNVERLECPSTAFDLDGAETPVVGRAIRRVQRGERSSCARDSVAAGTQHFAKHEDLIAAQPHRADREARRRTRASSHAGINASESREQNV